MRSPFTRGPRVVPLTDKGTLFPRDAGDRSISTLFPGGDLRDLGPSRLSLHAALNECGALRTAVSTCDPNTRDPDGDRCPLHWAAARGHMKCAMALVEAGADPRQIEISTGMNCAELASSRGHDYLAMQLRRPASPKERGSATPTEDDSGSSSSRGSSSSWGQESDRSPTSERRAGRRPLSPEPFGEPPAHVPRPRPTPAERYLQPEPEPFGEPSPPPGHAGPARGRRNG